MKKKNNKKGDQISQLTEEQKQQMMRFGGLLLSLAGAFLLTRSGCHIDYKINGEDIHDIEKLTGMDITDRLELALKEERYEDAAKLKKLLDSKKGDK